MVLNTCLKSTRLETHPQHAQTIHGQNSLILLTLQVWDDIAGQLAQREAEIVLLVHRLDKLEPERVGRKVPGSFDVMTGITSASQQGGLESIAELLRTETAKADFSGKVGDCCDEEMVSQACFRLHLPLVLNPQIPLCSYRAEK